MKLSLVAFLVATVSAKTISHKNAAKVLKNARRLEDAGGDDAAEEEEEFAFLMNYNLKMRSCIAGEAVQDPDTGEYDYNAIVFRLCPASGDCDSDSVDGCDEGYGDYIVGLNDFIEAYMEDQKENMQGDDNFNVEEYAECREYENENDDGDGNVYYIGPACSEDGTDVMLQLFADEDCSYVPEDVTFEDVSGGWSLPYGDGGLVSSYCMGCAGYNDDGEYEVSEMCERLYEEAGGKCETEMEYYHYYGKQEGSCEHILELMPVLSTGGAGKVIGWLLLIVVVVVFAGYVVWWKKSEYERRQEEDRKKLEWWKLLRRRQKAAGTASDGLMA